MAGGSPAPLSGRTNAWPGHRNSVESRREWHANKTIAGELLGHARPVDCFLLAASSIACLLADFYRLCPMRLFTPFIFLPTLVLLLAFAILDRLRGNRKLWRAVRIGLVAGLLAAVAYDVFRIRFESSEAVCRFCSGTVRTRYRIVPSSSALPCPRAENREP